MRYFEDEHVESRNMFQRISEWFFGSLVLLLSRFISIFILVSVQVIGIETLLFFAHTAISLREYALSMLVRLLYVFSAMCYSRMYRYCVRYASEQYDIVRHRVISFFRNGVVLFILSSLLALFFCFF